MRRFSSMWIYAAGTAVSAFVFRFTDCLDSLVACLSVALAVDIVTSMLRMCNRLLDPPVGIFVAFSLRENDLSHYPHMP